MVVDATAVYMAALMVAKEALGVEEKVDLEDCTEMEKMEVAKDMETGYHNQNNPSQADTAKIPNLLHHLHNESFSRIYTHYYISYSEQMAGGAKVDLEGLEVEEAKVA